MSVAEGPAAAAEPAAEARRCPRCGSALTPEQEWCLNCGSEVGTTIASPPSWRGPVLLVGSLLAIAVIALVLALIELAGDPEQVTPVAATPAPTAAATPAPTPESTTIPPAATATPTISEWPAGTTAWTIVLESSATREAADARAGELAGQGVAVGVLDSNDFTSLEPDRFVVFSGQYDSRRAADQARQDLSGQVAGAYVRRVVPENATGGATPTPSPTAGPAP